MQGVFRPFPLDFPRQTDTLVKHEWTLLWPPVISWKKSLVIDWYLIPNKSFPDCALQNESLCTLPFHPLGGSSHYAVYRSTDKARGLPGYNPAT
jgi:hypothetical protein